MSKHVKVLELTERRHGIINDSYNASQAVYYDDCESIGDLERVDFAQQKGVVAAIGVYRNTETGRIVIACRGTAGAMSILDTSPLAIGASPICTGKSKTTVAKFIKNYVKPGTDVVLTGHSKGAALAAVLSRETKLRAIVYDNPGVVGEKNHFCKVLSIQSTPNMVNDRPFTVNSIGGGSDGMTFSVAQLQKGRIIFLVDDAGIFKRTVRAAPLGGIFCGVSSHKINHIGCLIEDGRFNNLEKIDYALEKQFKITDRHLVASSGGGK